MGEGGDVRRRDHAVLIPYPAQGHVTPMLQVAKLLHSMGFHITFVNTEYNHKRLLRSRGAATAPSGGDESFRFEAIPDGMPPSEDDDATQDIPSLCSSITKHCLGHFRELLARLNAAGGGSPPVTLVVPDVFMGFGLDAAAEIGVPAVSFWTASACGFSGHFHYPLLLDEGFIPLKDENQITNGYLDTKIECIPGMTNLRLKDLPSFVRVTDVANDTIFNYIVDDMARFLKKPTSPAAIIMNTFGELEPNVLRGLSSIPLLPPVLPVGPLLLLARQSPPANGGSVSSLTSNLWKEDAACLQWLDGRKPGSVVYVNFGSVAVLTGEQLVEFAWGLVNSGCDFLWVIRPDLVRDCGGNGLPPELMSAIQGKGFLAGWCPQEAVLRHKVVGGFLTHGGWNSVAESICGGVPMLCWPFFAEQTTNCRYLCEEWGIGLEIDGGVRREAVAALVKELMGEGEAAVARRKKVREWKEKADEAAKPGGTSFENFKRVFGQLMLQPPIEEANGIMLGAVDSAEIAS